MLSLFKELLKISDHYRPPMMHLTRMQLMATKEKISWGTEARNCVVQLEIKWRKTSKNNIFIASLCAFDIRAICYLSDLHCTLQRGSKAHSFHKYQRCMNV